MQAHVVIPVLGMRPVQEVVQVITWPYLSISTRRCWLTPETGWQWRGRMWTVPLPRTGLECTLPPSVGQLMSKTMLPLNGRYMDAVHDTSLQACRLVASLVKWKSWWVAKECKKFSRLLFSLPVCQALSCSHEWRKGLTAVSAGQHEGWCHYGVSEGRSVSKL